MKKSSEKIGFVFMWVSAGFTAIIVVVIFAFLLSESLGFWDKYPLTDFIFGLKWKPSAGSYGILPMIVGSILTTAISLLLAIPLGALSAIYVKYYTIGIVKRIFEWLVGILASIPSVVFGLFGLSFLVPLIKIFGGGTGFSLLGTSVMLSIMILPTTITLYTSELNAIPKEFYINSLALGETKERSIFKCVIPMSSYGVFSAGILSLGRAVGETMAVLMVAGNVAIIPKSLGDGVRTLTTNISLEMGYATGQHRQALIACGLVLLTIVLLIEILIFQLKRKFLNEK